MEQIFIGNHSLKLNFDTQISPNGRPLRLSGISIVTDKEPIWANNMLCHGTIYEFRFLDKDEFIGFEYSETGKFLKKHENINTNIESV